MRRELEDVCLSAVRLRRKHHGSFGTIAVSMALRGGDRLSRNAVAGILKNHMACLPKLRLDRQVTLDAPYRIVSGSDVDTELTWLAGRGVKVWHAVALADRNIGEDMPHGPVMLLPMFILSRLGEAYPNDLLEAAHYDLTRSAVQDAMKQLRRRGFVEYNNSIYRLTDLGFEKLGDYVRAISKEVELLENGGSSSAA